MNNTASMRKPWILTIAFALIFTLAGTGGTVAAQDTAIPEGAPVDIHSGTCADIVSEPAYDAGDIGIVNTNDVWDDDSFQSGIFNDAELQATGIDFNGDGQLQADEVITPNGVDTDLGMAEADLGSDVDTSSPYVVAVHASPDAYSTIIACGSIDGAQQNDGNTVVYLHPTEDSNLFGFSVLNSDNTSLTTYLFTPNSTPIQASTAVSEQLGLMGHPVGVHSGVCTDYTAEPANDLGDFLQTNAYADGEQDPGDMEGQVPAAAEDLGPVYKLDGQDADLGDGSVLDEGQYVVAVHESADNYTPVIACGQILPVMDNGNRVVFLNPVGGSGQVGYVDINQDDGTTKGFLWEMQDYSQQQAAETTPIMAGTAAPIVTEAATTPTQEATAVIVETEIVSAEEATAIAEGTSAGQMQAVPVEIGGDSGEAITVSPNQSLTLNNGSDNDRTFQVTDLDLNATVSGGEQTELLIPENAESGSYTYQVLEGDNVVLEGDLTIQ